MMVGRYRLVCTHEGCQTLRAGDGYFSLDFAGDVADEHASIFGHRVMIQERVESWDVVGNALPAKRAEPEAKPS